MRDYHLVDDENEGAHLMLDVMLHSIDDEVDEVVSHQVDADTNEQ